MHTDQLEECVRLIAESERPVMYVGGGISAAGCETELQALAEKLSCPVTTTLMGVGSFPPDHLLSLDVLGMHGSKYANLAINQADLVLALGVRFDDRVTGKPEEFAKPARIIHIDIDHGELNKNRTVTMPVCADLKPALQQLLFAVTAVTEREWNRTVRDWKQEFPYPVGESDGT